MEEVYNDDLNNSVGKSQTLDSTEELKLSENRQIITEIRSGQPEIKKLDNQDTNPNKGLNSWSLAEKMIFIQSLSIQGYHDSFEDERLNTIHDIRFSNDGKLSFICKKY